jgi:hypothetical protein
MTLDLLTAFKAFIDKKKAGTLSWLDGVELADAVAVAILIASGRRPRPMGAGEDEEDATDALLGTIEEYCQLTGTPMPVADSSTEGFGAGPLLPILIQLLPVLIEWFKKKA